MSRTNTVSLCLAFVFALAGCSGFPVKPNNATVTVNVTAPSSTVSVFGTLQFAAQVTGSSNTAVTWQVNGTAGGSQSTGFISSSGLFVAPGSAPSQGDGTPIPVTITAVSQASSTASGSG